jgi:hypothetical protein
MAYTNLTNQVRIGVRGLPYVGLFNTYTGSNAAYSLRKLGSYTGPAVRVRRGSDNSEMDINFNFDGTLDTTSLLNFTNPVAATFSILDNYTGASAAYSLRKVRTAYTGAAIRVRRSSDNQEMDIAFNASGDLDTSTLLSFVGSGDGFVARWYDQSGNNDYAYNTTASSQPRIVISGVVTTSGNRPAIYWDNSRPDFLRINTKSWSGINTIRSSFVSMKWVTGTGNTPIFGQTNDASYHPDTTGANLILSEAYASYDIKYGALYLNGTSKALNQFSKSINSNILVSMIQLSQIGYFNLIGNDRGYAAPAGYFKGYYSEIIIYPTSQAANRTLIESNMNGYYSIYGDAYVTKWYDQSGSGRHAAQVTSSFQPQIVSGCSLILRSGKPAIYFDGVDDTLRLSTVLPISDITTLFTVAFANYENSSNDIVFGRRGAASYRFGGGNTLINSLCITRAESSDYLYASTPASTTGLNTLAVFHNHYAFGNYDGLNRTRIYSNGVWRNDGNSFGQSAWNNIEYIGSGGDCQFFKNTIQELIHYPSNQINNRIAIESNINSYYSIWNRNAVVSNGLFHNFDMSDINSYLTTGTELFNLSATSSTVKGTLVGSPTFATASGGVLNFNGSTQYLSIAGLSSALNNVSKFSYETWIKVTNPSSASAQTIFSFGNQGVGSVAANDIMFFFVSNQICLQVNNGADGSAISSFTSTAWNNISVVYDGTQTGNENRLKLYINGVQQTLTFNTYNVPSITSNLGFTNVGIGAYSSGGYNNKLTGSFGESRLYTRALTDVEITQNFNITKSRFGL